MEKYINEIKEDLSKKNPLYIKAKISTKANKTEIFNKLENGIYKIRVSAIPEKGKANIELQKFLKKTFKLKESQIVSGGRDSMKLIRLSL